jgi:hypothetical protein
MLLAVLYFVAGLLAGLFLTSLAAISWVVRRLRPARLKGTPLEEVIAEMGTIAQRLDFAAGRRR